MTLNMLFPKTNYEVMEHFSASKDVKISDSREFQSFSKLKHFGYVETSLISCSASGESWTCVPGLSDVYYQEVFLICWRKYELSAIK